MIASAILVLVLWHPEPWVDTCTPRGEVRVSTAMGVPALMMQQATQRAIGKARRRGANVVMIDRTYRLWSNYVSPPPRAERQQAIRLEGRAYQCTEVQDVAGVVVRVLHVGSRDDPR